MKQDTKKLEQKILDLETELNAEKEARLLTLADFHNYKKRLENEKNDYRIFATKLIITQLMQIADDFERMKNDLRDKLNQNTKQDDVLNAVQLINDKVNFLINQNGFEEIKIVKGDKFDSATMEAISSTPLTKDKDNEDKDNTVVHVDQKGYKHVESGLVFKTAKVIIAKVN